jgi:hypothetical protein
LPGVIGPCRTVSVHHLAYFSAYRKGFLEAGVFEIILHSWQQIPVDVLGVSLNISGGDAFDIGDPGPEKAERFAKGVEVVIIYFPA